LIQIDVRAVRAGGCAPIGSLDRVKKIELALLMLIPDPTAK
jgi:hypothetical protein